MEVTVTLTVVVKAIQWWGWGIGGARSLRVNCGYKFVSSDFQFVKKGTNGGVTKRGLLAAAAAGSVIGLSFVLLGISATRCEGKGSTVLKQLPVIPVATLAGLCGSVIDSLLGATLQFSGFCSIRGKMVGKPGSTVRRISGANILDNNAVNFVSIMLYSHSSIGKVDFTNIIIKTVFGS
ncbi:Protein PGR [Glycine soja]